MECMCKVHQLPPFGQLYVGVSDGTPTHAAKGKPNQGTPLGALTLVGPTIIGRSLGSERTEHIKTGKGFLIQHPLHLGQRVECALDGIVLMYSKSLRSSSGGSKAKAPCS